MPIQLKFRRSPAAFWTVVNPTLAAGEIAIETDTQQFKIGDGLTAWNSLGYAGIEGPVGSGQFMVTSSGAGRVFTSDGTLDGAIAQTNLTFNSNTGTLSTNTISTLRAVCGSFTTVNLSSISTQTDSLNVNQITYPDTITIQTDSLSAVCSTLVVAGDVQSSRTYTSMTYDYTQLLQPLVSRTLDSASATLSKLWTGVEVSGTGQYQVATQTGTGIYVSVNYGVTWTAQNVGAGSLSYVSPGMSKSGQYMTVPVSGSGSLYRSADYGQTWATIASAGTADWRKVSISASGEYQTAVSLASGIYLSADYGQTWQQSSAPISSAQWTSVAVSATGQYQVAVSSYVASPLANGYIYVSSDYGQTWVAKNTANSTLLYRAVTVSASAQYMTAVAAGSGNLWVSSDYGQTWAKKATSTLVWLYVTMSDSGQYQVACLSASGTMYVSVDYGATWTSKSTATTWRAAGFSGSGQYMTAVAATASVAGFIYTCTLPTYFSNGMTISTLSIGATYSTSVYTLQVATNSAAKPTTSTWKISSDRRIKTDIESADLELCYSTIRALDIKYFEWNSNFYSADFMKDRHVLGFIAQDVKHVFPKSVRIHDTFQIGNNTLTDFHTLNVDQIQAANIGAVKRLMELVGNQEATVSSLTGRYDAQQSTLLSQFSLRQSTIDGYSAV